MDDVGDFRSAMIEWYSVHGREYPWRDRDASLYEVFVAEFFLTQTPAENVFDVYPGFLERFPSLKAIDDTKEETLQAAIQPLGFQRMRASALDKIAEEYDSLPRDTETLQTLPRVGPYVANATLCFALDQCLPIMDRNVRRVYERVLSDSYPRAGSDDESALASRLLPSDGRAARKYNLGLLDLGAAICTKSDPLCEECPVSAQCDYYDTE